MQAQEIIKSIESKFGLAVVSSKSDVRQPYVFVKREKIHEIMAWLKNESKLSFDFLRCITGIDQKDRFELVYHLYSYAHKHEFIIKTELPKESPSIDSISDIYGVANWNERETFDLLGIDFKNHPDLRRILLPDDWEGYPLRKDYKEPEEYRGISHKR